jgi:glycosyltransferase involved in cell wall biosynthesis
MAAATTVVIATYNREQMLRETVESVQLLPDHRLR